MKFGTMTTRGMAGDLAVHKVLRNTYLLLGLTFVFSALCAIAAMTYQLPQPGPLMFMIGMFGLLMIARRTQNSVWGLPVAFLFTGFMGYTLAPMINFYLHAFSNGPEILMTALGGTGLIFLSLSAYVLATGKDFSYMGGMLFVAIIVGLLASVASLFFTSPVLFVGVSALFVLISSGLILFYTSMIINGGERNYISAALSLFIALLNLFTSLLQILGIFGGSRD